MWGRARRSSFGLLPVTVTPRGYSVTDTTADSYPQRSVLEQATMGALQWRMLSADFHPA
jgi:hypothetical protein